MLLPVIMAGGSGTRLWPVSRQFYPKQFCALTGERTMLQETVQRLDGLDCAPPMVICNEEHRFLAAEQLRLIGSEDATIILEPDGRNTAPAIALAALRATQQGDDPLLLVLAADHLIADGTSFIESVRKACGLAEKGMLVTFGVVADRPETGYGYIERGAEIEACGYAVSRFEEKPDAATARHYLDTGNYYWNSGMFLFRASAYLDELQRHAPEVLEACRRATATVRADLDFHRVDEAAFRRSPKISVDYAVMEHTDKAVVVPLDAGWSDIGSWAALSESKQRDADGNALKGDVIAFSTTDTFVEAGRRLVAVLGVKDLVVIETADAVLVAHKNNTQDVKKVVEVLKTRNRGEHLNHRRVYRPWGDYDSVDASERDQVKRITVKPGAKLSVQKHYHRAEHWVVVRGAAKVQKGDETLILSENQSTYIPVGEIHSLENPGKIPLQLIEVQSGSYLGEDDIVRFEDKYGRA